MQKQEEEVFKIILNTKSKFYRVWVGMVNRSSNLKDKNYGGRGIKVCKRWLKFKNFYQDMYEEYCKHTELNGENTSIDRIDNNGNYKLLNCRWATSQEQADNRRNGRYITYKGETKSSSEWARSLGIHRQVLYGRLKKGWSLDRALTKSNIKSNGSIDDLISEVLSGKYGTKNRSQLLIQLNNFKIRLN